MRVTSGLWVAAYLRQMNSAGVPAVLVQRGAEEAGAIFVIVDCLDGTARLFCPVAGFSAERLWEPAFGAERKSRFDISAYLDRQRTFDPDLWIIDVEVANGVPQGLPVIDPSV